MCGTDGMHTYIRLLGAYIVLTRSYDVGLFSSAQFALAGHGHIIVALGCCRMPLQHVWM